VFQKVWVPSDPAQFLMKSKIALEKIPGVFGNCRPAHAIHRRLQFREISPSDRRKARRQSLDCATQFIELDNILLGQEDHSSAASQLLRDKSVPLQNVDRFSNRALGDTEFLCPFSLDDSHPGRQCAFHNLGEEAFRKITRPSVVTAEGVGIG
jgi:hypothetical protein